MLPSKQDSSLPILDASFKERLTAFINAVNVRPADTEIKKRRHDNIAYIPIEVVEAKLNQYFFGLWQTVNFKYQVIVNELVGDLELVVYHPEAGVWLRRSGTGAVLIQQKAERDEKGRKKEVDVLDVSKKIANTLEKDMGHLKADCIKNAAKSLGVSFGANLLRDTEDGDRYFMTPESAMEAISKINSIEDLHDYYRTLDEIVRNDRRIQMVFKERKLQLKKK